MSAAMNGKPNVTREERLQQRMAAAKPKRSKYGATRTNGYASKREARFAHDLGMLKLAGKVSFWFEQVPIKLSPGVKYVLDFMVFEPDGKVRFIEVKGFETAMWKVKMKLLATSHPEIAARLEVIK